MTINNFTPEVWAERILSNMNVAHVFKPLCNTDYEGEISGFGDTVHVQALGRVTLLTYTKNTNLTAAETLTDATVPLVIDQANAFNFQIDDIDKAQNKGNVMSEAMKEAAYMLANTVDAFIAGLYTDVAAGNTIANFVPTTGTEATKIYENLVSMAVLLDEANVPSEGRWGVLPPWVEAFLLKDDRFIGYNTGNHNDPVSNGKIGRAAGFELFKSNNVQYNASDDYACLFGNKTGISFADQLVKTEAYTPELRFADAVKGLHVYGAKVVRPSALGLMYCSKS